MAQQQQQTTLPKEYTDVVLARRDGRFVWPEPPRYEQTKLTKEYRDAVSKVKKPRKAKAKPVKSTLRQGKMDAFVRRVSEAEFSLLLGAEKVTAPANTEFVFFSPDIEETTGAKIRRGEGERSDKPYERTVTIPRQLRFTADQGGFAAIVFRRSRNSPYHLHEAKVDIVFEDGHLVAVGTAEISVANNPLQLPITAQLFDVAVSSALVTDLFAAVAVEPVHYQRFWDIATRHARLFHIPGLSQHLDTASLIPRQQRPRGERSFLWIHTRMSHMGMTLDNWDFDNAAIVVLFMALASKIMGFTLFYNRTLVLSILKRAHQMSWSHLLHLFIFTQFMDDRTAANFHSLATSYLTLSGHTWFKHDAFHLIARFLSIPVGKTFVTTFPWKIDNSNPQRSKPVRYAYIYDENIKEANKERAKDWGFLLRTHPDYLPMQIEYYGEWRDEVEDEVLPYFDLSWSTPTFFIFDSTTGTLYAAIVTYTQWQPKIVPNYLRLEIHFEEEIPELPTGFEKIEELRAGLSTRRQDDILAQEGNKHPLVQHFLQRMIDANNPPDYPFDNWLKEYGYASREGSRFRTADLSERLDQVLVKNWFPDEYDTLYVNSLSLSH